ncbi:hypothetical protein [Anseongella ginsenosidimutans]|uniref:hypothetical protein n=1 Tax=Anseongella ginsenosidimutans TaxID=496056 RepID=UPI001CEF65EA|nr:hypothetical protein [Anseongella ginsenosidimutans]
MITIENLDRMAMPVPLVVTESNGKEHTLKLPVEIWQRAGNGPLSWIPKPVCSR